MNMLRVAFVVVAALSMSCATPVEKPTPPAPPSQAQTSADAMELDVMRETRKTAAAELQCPEEQLLVTCTGRDALGGCVAIQAKGCEKTLEYSFGAQ